MKKQFFSLVLVLVMCLVMTCGVLIAYADFSSGDNHVNHPVCGESCGDASNHESIDWVAWNETQSKDYLTSLPGVADGQSKYYYLTDNVTLTETWNVPASANVTICLNGHNIEMSGDDVNGSVIIVDESATLNVTDCKGEGCIWGGSAEQGGVLNHGTFNLYGGAISSNEAQDNGDDDLTPVVTLVDADDADVTANYDLTYEAGTLTKATANVTAPVAAELIYNGTAQALVTDGSTDGGTMKYSLSEDGEYSAEIPTGTDAGDYTVWYMVEGGSLYDDVAAESVTVTIAPKPCKVMALDQAVSEGGEFSTASEKYTVEGLVGEDSAEVTLSLVQTENSIQPSIKIFNSKQEDITDKNYTVEIVSGKLTYKTGQAAIVSGKEPVIVQNPVYDGTEQSLLMEAGEAEGGTLLYKVNDGDYSTAIPVATEAGKYTIYYMVEGDDEHTDLVVETPLVVTIAKASIDINEIVTEKPADAQPIYNGTAQALATPGSALDGFTILYSSSRYGKYSEAIPTAISAGSYNVWYKVVPKDEYKANYLESESTPSAVAASIRRAPSSYAEGGEPQVPDLIYTGYEQYLLTEGTAIGGTIYYSGNGETFTTTRPHAIHVGTYDAYYKIIGDDNHENSDTTHVEVSISGRQVEYEENAPKPIEDLVYNGEDQLLMDDSEVVTDGSYRFVYSLGDEDGEYSADIPTGKNAGTYTVYYKEQAVNDESGDFADSQARHYDVIIGKLEASVDTKPVKIENLIYNGEEQVLLTGGTALNGELEYSLTENGEYSAEIPAEKNAGTYTVYYKAINSDTDNYASSVPEYETVTIAKKQLVIPEGAEPRGVEDFKYDGNMHELIIQEGEVEGGKFYYYDGIQYRASIPIAIEVGEYTLMYKLEPDDPINFEGIYDQVIVVNVLSGGGSDVIGGEVKPGGDENTSGTSYNGSHHKTLTYRVLSFDTAGGTDVTAMIRVSGTSVPLDQVPVREGFTFTGWYTDAALTERVTTVQLSKNMTVYAGWQAGDYADADREVAMLDTVSQIAYIGGYEDGTLRPNDSITRAEIATIFMRLLNSDVREEYFSTNAEFSDVVSGSWCNDAIATLSKCGLVKGYPDGTFKPNAKITRAEFAVIASRLSSAESTGKSNFADVSDSHWAAVEVALIENLGWVSGYPDGTFRPEDSITRAEAITMLNRILGRKLDDAAASELQWKDISPNAWYYAEIQKAVSGGAEAQ